MTSIAYLSTGNYRLALNKLQQTKTINKNESTHLRGLQINWMHCYLKTHLARSKFVNTSDERLNIFFGAQCLKELAKYDHNEELLIRKELKQEQQLLHGDFCQFLIKNLIGSGDYFDQINEKKMTQLCDFIKVEKSAPLDGMITSLLNHGVKSLLEINNDVNGSLRLSSYCDHFLRLIENEEENSTSKENSLISKIKTIRNDFPSLIITNLLYAIKNNSYEARQRFPRLLQIIETYGQHALNEFIRLSKSIPSWMFLNWLSQMTALLDRPEARGVYHIIEDISNEYPQVIFCYFCYIT